MKAIPTVMVFGTTSPDNPEGRMMINASDFDALLHKLVNPEDAPLVEKAAPVLGADGKQTPEAALAAEVAMLKQQLDDVMAANSEGAKQLASAQARVAELEGQLAVATMSAQDMKDALTKAGVDFAPNATKADLAALLQQLPKAA